MTPAVFDFDDIRRRRNIMNGLEVSGRVLNFDGTPVKAPVDNYLGDTLNSREFIQRMHDIYLGKDSHDRPWNWRMAQHLQAQNQIPFYPPPISIKQMMVDVSKLHMKMGKFFIRTPISVIAGIDMAGKT